MDQAELFGRVLKVNQAKPQQKAGEGLGSKTAVWEQVSLLILSFIHSFIPYFFFLAEFMSVLVWGRCG